jgi:hypothetical protein
VVKVISLVAVALAPIIACSVATAQVLTLHPTPNPFRAQPAPELASAYFLCVACYMFHGFWVALAACAALVGCAFGLFSALVGCAYGLYSALSLLWSVCEPACAFLLTSDGDAASSKTQNGGTSPSWSNKRDLRGDGGDERGAADNCDRRQERKERSKEDRRQKRGENDSNGDTAPAYTAEALPVAYPALSRV